MDMKKSPESNFMSLEQMVEGRAGRERYRAECHVWATVQIDRINMTNKIFLCK